MLVLGRVTDSIQKHSWRCFFLFRFWWDMDSFPEKRADQGFAMVVPIFTERVNTIGDSLIFLLNHDYASKGNTP